MFTTLLESRSRVERSLTGTIASVVAHTGLVAAVLYATAQAHVAAPVTPDIVHPVYFPPRIAQAPLVRNPSSAATVTRLRPPAFIDTRLTIDVSVPIIDVGGAASKPSDFPATWSTGDPGLAPRLGDASDAPLRADQVERQVAVVPGSPPPKYPEILRNSAVEGQVIAVFVVDASGRAEVDSVRFARSDNQLFEEAVRTALRRMRFFPAEVGGRKVRQLVQMPFVFTISR
ncbi:MAG: energy transducer TonB [Gemmatimonadaceae bacterium]